MGSTDGTSISTNHLAYRWKVEIKREESIKEERGNKIEEEEIEKRNTVANHNQTCNVI